ncbi:MAG: diguanylate cyclase domain-containing protein, partial [Alphaproteobacteria bacterium]
MPRRRLGVALAAAFAGLLVPAPLVAGAAVLVVAGGGVILRRVRARLDRAAPPPRTTDPLTGLADAAALRAFVHAELDGRARRVALLWLELRQVALLRSTFGREALEALCTTSAGRLRRSVRAGDGLAHFGDGLFAVALRDAGDAVGFARTAERLRAELTRPLAIAGTRVRPSWAVAGVAAPEDGRTGDA